MNITEANAVVHVLRRFGVIAGWDLTGLDGDTFDDDMFEVALTVLCERAGKALQMTFRPSDDLPDWLHAVDSDGAAQAVCRALADHQAHGGAIPWPKVRGPFEDWKQLRDGAP